jgi:thiol-disulfide isomerase/thioredoxin
VFGAAKGLAGAAVNIVEQAGPALIENMPPPPGSGNSGDATRAAGPPPTLPEEDFDSLVGQTLDTVHARLGRPIGSVKQGSRVVWMYDGFSVTSLDGETIAEVDTQAGAVLPPAPTGVPSSAPARPTGPAVQKISDGGQRVDMKELLVPGRVTVVDFYADWCGPCRVMAPHLEQIASQDDDVFLRKVDIVRWGTPVTKQYAIASVPNVRVFDRAGRQIGEPTHSLKQIKAAIQKAK